MAMVINPAMVRSTFAREDTEPLPGQVLQPLPEGPRVPLAMIQQQQHVMSTPRQAASLSLPVAKREVIQTKAPEVCQTVLWERPPKPAGWSAIWEVLPPPPPPPLDEDGVWIWVPEGEDIPVGAIVPHEALLPHADVDEESDLDFTEGHSFPQFGTDELEQNLEQTTNAGFSDPSTFQAWQPFPPHQSGPAEEYATQDHKLHGLAGQSNTQAWQPFSSHMSVPGAESSSQQAMQVPASQPSSRPADPTSQVWQPFPSQVSMPGAEGSRHQAMQVPASQPSSRPADPINQQVWQPFPSQVSMPGAEGNSQQAMQIPASQPSSRPADPTSQVWQPFPSQVSMPGAEGSSQQATQAPASQPSSRNAEQAWSFPSQMSGHGVACGSQQVPTSLNTPREAWQPFPSQMSGPVEPQGWNPWATNLGTNEAAFYGSVSGNEQRRIIGDIGAFDSGDFRSSPAFNSRPSMPPSPAQSGRGWTGCGALPSNHEEMRSLEGTAFWQVPPASTLKQPSGPLSFHQQLQSNNQAPQARSTYEMPAAANPASQGSVPFGSRPSVPSNESAGRSLLTSTSEGLEVTYAITPQQASGQVNTHQLPSHHGFAGTNQSAGCVAAPWPMPSNLPGQSRNPQGVQLLDVTGMYQEQGSGQFRARDVLGPMRPDDTYTSRAGQTWMNDPRLARQPVAQVAERNRHAAPVLLDVSLGHRAYAPDD
ncbi:FKBP9 [Symbiodinium natans]|uniref:FKBP9 protein n=1 Tax=Symbiodinium natans TaxID=878477 RepID=A0A812T3B1_9DINO|nr:FKBP9 [Symbiodinium natans]